jgi:hypothetical protein
MLFDDLLGDVVVIIDSFGGILRINERAPTFV